MSAIYNLEPQPTGSAIIHTTIGEISVELFAKQTPLACRNFLQLALDGYYDDTIFHRLVPGFILQGGDPTGTGNGGESIFDGGAFSGDLDPWPMDERRGKNAGPQGVNFKDEFHSRLRFNRRGLLAMANEGRVDTNGSQFFFTLDKTVELNDKNTLFGRVAGDTIYNLMKIGESEIAEGTDRPLYPVKIQRIEILLNPFDDMKKRTRVAPQLQHKAPAAKDKKKKRKGGKQLLSFGDEEGDDDLPVLKKAKFDTRLITEEEESQGSPVVKKAPKPTPKKSPTLRSTEPAKPQVDGDPAKEDSESGEQGKKKTSTQRAAKDPSPEPPRQPSPPRKTALQKANEEIAALKASMKRTVHSEKPVEEREKTAFESMIPETSTKGGRKRRPGGSGNDDPKTFRLLEAFRSRLDKAPPEKEQQQQPAKPADTEQGGKEPEEGEAELCDLHFIANCQSCTSWDKQEKDDSDDEGWMSHTLSFAADKLGKDLSNRKKAEEELVVIDPREKARELKKGKRADRDAREGQSGRAWDQKRDQARNAKLAQAASLAGRGAK